MGDYLGFLLSLLHFHHKETKQDAHQMDEAGIRYIPHPLQKASVLFWPQHLGHLYTYSCIWTFFTVSAPIPRNFCSKWDALSFLLYYTPNLSMTVIKREAERIQPPRLRFPGKPLRIRPILPSVLIGQESYPCWPPNPPPHWSPYLSPDTDTSSLSLESSLLGTSGRWPSSAPLVFIR